MSSDAAYWFALLFTHTLKSSWDNHGLFPVPDLVFAPELDGGPFSIGISIRIRIRSKSRTDAAASAQAGERSRSFKAGLLNTASDDPL